MPELKIPEDLINDCDNCQGLCCVANKHVAEDGFPIHEDKPVGIPCRNLEVNPSNIIGEFNCRIHDNLERKGWIVCSNFTCHGAGQTVTAFFEEMSIKWNKQPKSIDDQEWDTTLGNLYYGYMVLSDVFRLLNHIRINHGEDAYDAGKTVAINLMSEFSRALERRDEEIDFVHWLMKRFDPEIKVAIEPFSKRPLRTRLERRCA